MSADEKHGGYLKIMAASFSALSIRIVNEGEVSRLDNNRHTGSGIIAADCSPFLVHSVTIYARISLSLLRGLRWCRISSWLTPIFGR